MRLPPDPSVRRVRWPAGTQATVEVRVPRLEKKLELLQRLRTEELVAPDTPLPIVEPVPPGR